MMNKKAQMNNLQGVIIGLLVLFFAFAFAAKLGAFTVKSADMAACQTSLLKSATLGTLKNSESFTQLSCNNLPDLEIKKSEVMRSNKINDAAVKRAINDKMFECWKMVGKGAIQPFGKLDGVQTYCLICSDVTFDDAFIKQAKSEGYKFKEFVYWQTQNSVPGLTKTYFEEFFGISPNSEIVEQVQQAQEPLNFEEQNEIVWTLKKDSVNADNPFVWLIAHTAVGQAYLAYQIIKGSETIATGVNLVPRSKFNMMVDGSQFCTKLVNY